MNGVQIIFFKKVKVIPRNIYVSHVSFVGSYMYEALYKKALTIPKFWLTVTDMDPIDIVMSVGKI
jgi:hypothetical protein